MCFCSIALGIGCAIGLGTDFVGLGIGRTIALGAGSAVALGSCAVALGSYAIAIGSYIIAMGYDITVVGFAIGLSIGYALVGLCLGCAKLAIAICPLIWSGRHHADTSRRGRVEG